MGLIELVYITDDRDQLIFQYLASLSTPSFDYIQSKIDQLKLIKQQQLRQQQDQTIDEEIYDSDELLIDPIVEIDKKNVVTSYKYLDFWFYVVGSLNENDVDIDVGGSDTSEEEEESTEEEEEEDEYEELENDTNTEKQESKKEESQKEVEEEHIKPPFQNINPLISIEFIKNFIIVLETYVSNPISKTKLTNKIEIVNLLLQNMIDYQYPFITDLNQLKELTPKDSIISKIINQTRKISTTATNNITRNSSSSSINSSSSIHASSHNANKSLAILESNNKIPWRKSNVKYSNNEMFVDLIETVNVIFPPRLHLKQEQQHYSSAFYNSSTTTYKPIKPIIATIDGCINFTSYLSGIPDLEMVLDVGRHDLGVPSFHPCIRTGKWETSHGQVLSFIPADGKFKLMDYKIDLLNNEKYGDSINEISRYLGLIDINFQIGLGSLQNEFEIKLNLQFMKNVKSIEDLKIDIFVKDQDSIKTLKLTHGDLLKISSTRYQWIFDKTMGSGISPMLHGYISSPNQAESYGNERSSSSIAPTSSKLQKRAPIFIKLNYTNKGSLPSGIKVSNLQILSAKGMGESVKPYKGVKYIAQTGDFILR